MKVQITYLAAEFKKNEYIFNLTYIMCIQMYLTVLKPSFKYRYLINITIKIVRWAPTQAEDKLLQSRNYFCYIL